MNCSVKTLVCLLAILLSNAAAQALTTDNPYHTIVDRNPFGLNPPPPPATNAPPEPPKNVKFNGITNVGGKKKAFFTLPGKEAKDPPQYVSLGETERSDALEVTKIFEDEGEVEVVNSGIKMVLNFKNNGNKGATLAAQPGMPPGAPQPMVPPQPGMQGGLQGGVSGTPAVYTPGNNPAVYANPAVYSPGQNEGLPSQPPLIQQPNFGSPPSPPPPEGTRTIPTRTLRLNPVGQP